MRALAVVPVLRVVPVLLLLLLLPCATAAPAPEAGTGRDREAALDADGYFELGLAYLKRGQYRTARAAFCESLVRAPGQPVPMALCGVACAGEGRPVGESARLFRWAYDRVPAGKKLTLPLHELLPGPAALAHLAKDHRARLDRGEAEERLARLTVVAFLEVHDADPLAAPALDRLRKERPKDRYGAALERSRSPE